MANIFVSAHGGRWDTQKKDLEIPSRSEVVYYVKDGEILSNDEGYKIFDKLTKGDEPGGDVIEKVTAGNKTYNYSCWYASDFAKHCGIFEVGTGDLLKNLESYTEDKPLDLSDIIKEFPDCIIYWVCCREIETL